MSLDISSPGSPATTETIPDELALHSIARKLAQQALHAPRVVLLEGEMAAGKTAFARAYIRTLVGDPALIVPSPTFGLISAYLDEAAASDGLPIYHIDFYRILHGHTEEVRELLTDLELPGHILIEWTPPEVDLASILEMPGWHIRIVADPTMPSTTRTVTLRSL